MQLTQILGLLIFHTSYKLIRAGFNECQTAKNCRQCIILNPKCAWCNVLEYKSPTTSRYKKCDTNENHISQGCTAIHNPRSSANITKAAKLGGDIRVSPQAITVKLRPGEPTNVKITIKTPKNFPIDLYYLMDLSLSMQDDLKQVEKLGDLLSTEMTTLTSNFRLGFGGYVDKPLAPYTITWDKEINDMLKKNPGIEYTFAFKNYLPLNEDTNEFEKSIQKVKISFNRDSPEGSLDALMQVIVCNNAIGWRDKKHARRIIIITTDQTFHYSGDGLLGGVVRPNEGTCLLKNDTEYIGWNKFDYPSLSQIRALLIDNQIIPIFASLGNEDLYAEVAKFFGQKSGAVAQKLASDSSNVVPLIREAYQKIAKKVGITSTAPNHVSVSFHTNCGEDGKDLTESSSCNNVSIGQEVIFEARITARDCKMGAKDKRPFELKTDFGDIDVTLEMICNCPCEHTEIANSPECFGNGTLSCGLCQCDGGFGGSVCSCTSEAAKDEASCRIPGIIATCSNAGVCDCGECICNGVTKEEKTGVFSYTYGDQCQCSNATCGRSNSAQICGGPDRGKCDCGKCNCDDNWTGDTCQESCVQSKQACTGKNGVICGGKGKCVCNRCVCDDGHVGEQCQECVERCPDPCEDYKECVKCLEFDTSELTVAECHVECANHNISRKYNVVDKIDQGQRRCIARDEDDCSFVYTYSKLNDTVLLVVQEGLICPAEPDIVAIILGVIAGIVGIGLALLLIWKLLATIQDRRDFAMFEKDRQNPKWDSGENPIYKEATSTFQNPMFKKTVPS